MLLLSRLIAVDPVRCRSDSAPGMLVIWQMALRELKGWV
jgi:hypothetical protein